MNDRLRAAETQQPESPAISEQELQLAIETLRSEQKLLPGSVAGLVASLLGAGIWAAVAIVAEAQVGIVAIAIGFLVGLTIRHVGKGIDPVFGMVAALQSLFGCAVGNILTISYFIAQSEGVPFIEVLTQLDLEIMTSLLVETFEVMDLLFYGLAAYVGYRYAFREVTTEDINRALGKSF